MLKNENRVQRNSIISRKFMTKPKRVYNSEYDEKFPDNISCSILFAIFGDFMYFL